MPRKKKIMDSVVFNNGGSKTMIKPDERAKIRRLMSSAMTFFQGKRNETFPERFTIVS